MYPGDYDNDPNLYAGYSGNTLDDQPYDPDVGNSDLADDSQFKPYDPETTTAMPSGAPVDYGGGGGYDDASGGENDCCGGDDCCKCGDGCGDGCCGDGCCDDGCCGDGCCDDGCCNWCGGDDEDDGCCS